MSGRFRLRAASENLHRSKPDEPLTIPGELGLKLGGESLVEVPNRPGFVYVRLRNDLSETVQAYNDRVTPIYGLPVTVVRDRVDRGRYYISGRDVGRYNNWGSSSYLPRHGAMHSFNPDAPGLDPVWIWSRQFTPMLGVPSGSSASMNVLVYPGTLYYDNRWIYAGMTGTADLSAYKPTGTDARMLLVYLDQDGNPQVESGLSFDASFTGTQQVYPYLPAMPTAGLVPIAGVRLVSGTSNVSWDNMYDLRQFLHWGVFTGTAGSGGGGGHVIQDDGSPLPQRAYLNFAGPNFYVFDDPTNGATVVSGSATTTQIKVGTSQIAFGTATNGLTGTSKFVTATPTSDGEVSLRVNGISDVWGYANDYALNLISQDVGSDRQLALWNYISGSSSTNYRDYPPQLSFFSAKNNDSDPRALASGVSLGELSFYGWGANDFYLGGMIRFDAIAPTSDSYMNTVLRIALGSSGSTFPLNVVHAHQYEFYRDRMISLVPVVVSTGTNQGYYWGNIFTDGSWRTVVANDRIEFQKRVSGLWVTQGWSTTGSSGGSGISDHALLENLNSANYSHLTAAQVTDLTDGGASTAHKHDHGGQDGLADNDHAQYNYYPAQGRLTLETGVPVSTADQSAKATLYYTPFRGDKIALYDGSSAWALFTFTELSLSLAGLTASKPYDIFCYNNSGTPTLEALVWTNATTRATALTTQNGVLVKSGATTRRYLGTIYINSSGGQTDDKVTKRNVWNYYNRALRMVYVQNFSSHQYNGALRLWNNSETNNRIEYVNGVAEDARVFGLRASQASAASGNVMNSHLFQDGSTISMAVAVGHNSANAIIGGISVTTMPAVGMHYLNVYQDAVAAGSWFYGFDLDGAILA